MKSRLRKLWGDLSASYWFIPSVMAALSIVLSIITIELDKGIGRDVQWVAGVVYVDSAEGARAVLSTVASSMITVAGVVFSLTMVVLSLTSQQYGPLVLSHFMHDRGNQIVLGIFTATFLYCLLILRTIRGGETDVFVPHISVLIGLLLSVASLAVLIYFINHIARSIQAPYIIARIHRELNEQIDHQFPAPIGDASARDDEDRRYQSLLAQVAQEGAILHMRQSGYLQVIDHAGLLDIAQKHDLVLQLEVLPGEFLFPDQPIGRVLPSGALSDDIERAVQEVFIFGSQRTREQDIGFIVTQLSAIAVRALSPSMNDPYTALAVIDHLGETLCTVLRRQQPSCYRLDEDRRVRVIASSVDFQALFQIAFDQIIHYGHSDLKVDGRLLHSVGMMWRCTDSLENHTLLRHYAARIYEAGQARLTGSEQAQLVQAYQGVMRLFAEA